MDVCPLCNTAVAPFDRTRQRLKKRVFHGNCLLNPQLSVRDVERITSRKRFRIKDLFFRQLRD